MIFYFFYAFLRKKMWEKELVVMNFYRIKKNCAVLFEDYQLGAETFPKATALALIGTGLLLMHFYMMGLYFCLPGVLFLLGAALEDNAHREVRRKLLIWAAVFFIVAQWPVTTGFMTIYELDLPLMSKVKVALNETILGKAVFSFCFYFVCLISFTFLEWLGDKIGRTVSIGGGDILFFTVMTTIFPFFLFMIGMFVGSFIVVVFSFFWKRPSELAEGGYKYYPPAIPGLLFGMGVAPLVQKFLI